MKIIVYGFSAIITLVVVIALLGTINSFVKEIVSELSVGVATRSNYCVYDSDCSKAPQNCSSCANTYSLSLGLMQPCQNTIGNCVCESNKCKLLS